ncbi:hypothetical protein DFH06DRAFT_1151882 [Mycena polygramma]|nr:hypothetical protein DFH06DRAFT_1151882 [Mycena polygramma]
MKQLSISTSQHRISARSALVTYTLDYHVQFWFNPDSNIRHFSQPGPPQLGLGRPSLCLCLALTNLLTSSIPLTPIYARRRPFSRLLYISALIDFGLKQWPEAASLSQTAATPVPKRCGMRRSVWNVPENNWADAGAMCFPHAIARSRCKDGNCFQRFVKIATGPAPAVGVEDLINTELGDPRLRMRGLDFDSGFEAADNYFPRTVETKIPHSSPLLIKSSVLRYLRTASQRMRTRGYDSGADIQPVQIYSSRGPKQYVPYTSNLTLNIQDSTCRAIEIMLGITPQTMKYLQRNERVNKPREELYKIKHLFGIQTHPCSMEAQR